MEENKAEEMNVEISTDLLAKMVTYASYKNANCIDCGAWDVQRKIDERAIAYTMKLETDIREKIKEIAIGTWKNPEHEEYEDVSKISVFTYYLGYIMGCIDIADILKAEGAGVEIPQDKMIQSARESLETQRDNVINAMIGIFESTNDRTDITLEDKLFHVSIQAFVWGYRDCYVPNMSEYDPTYDGEHEFYEDDPEIDT